MVGGGFIGIEAAENLQLAGKDVTLAELSGQILQPFDEDMDPDPYRRDWTMALHGVKLLLHTNVQAITESRA
ncbi:MAG: NAD-binding protein [Oscillospiraceae bacterium]